MRPVFLILAVFLATDTAWGSRTLKGGHRRPKYNKKTACVKPADHNEDGGCCFNYNSCNEKDWSGQGYSTRITCAGKRTCAEAVLPDYDVECKGSNSCVNVQLIDSHAGLDLKCNGMSSCDNLVTTPIGKLVQCNGKYSCDYAKLFSSVKCVGRDSCAYATVKNKEPNMRSINIDCSGPDTCRDLDIENTAQTTVDCQGTNSCRGIELQEIQDEKPKVTINCGGNDACSYPKVNVENFENFEICGKNEFGIKFDGRECDTCPYPTGNPDRGIGSQEGRCRTCIGSNMFWNGRACVCDKDSFEDDEKCRRCQDLGNGVVGTKSGKPGKGSAKERCQCDDALGPLKKLKCRFKIFFA